MLLTEHGVNPKLVHLVNEGAIASVESRTCSSKRIECTWNGAETMMTEGTLFWIEIISAFVVGGMIGWVASLVYYGRPGGGEGGD